MPEPTPDATPVPEAPPPAKPARRDVPAEIIAHLWSRRWFIARVMVPAIVLFTIVLLLIPKQYRAEATVILLPPRFTSDVRTEPLSVPTAMSLLRSGELAAQVIRQVRAGNAALAAYAAERGGVDKLAERLAEQGESLDAEALRKVAADPLLADWLLGMSPAETVALMEMDAKELADWTVDALLRSFSTEDIVEKKTATDIKLSPLIRLLVVSDTGARAQMLANTWALLFTRMYDEIANSKTHRQYESILKQQQASTQELEDVSREVVEFKSANNLELYLRLIEQHSINLTEFLLQRTERAKALASEERRLQELIQIHEAVTQPDGTWVGSFEPDLDATTGTRRRVGTRTAEVKSLPESYAVLRGKAVESLAMMETAMSNVERFYENYPVEMIENDLAQLKIDHVEAESRLRTGLVRMQTLTDSLASLDETLSDTQQFLVISKQLPDETIGQALMSGSRDNVRAVANIQFREEQLNPVWDELQKQRAKVSIELEQVRSEVLTLQEKLPYTRAEVLELQSLMYRARMQELPIKANLEHWQAMNTKLADSFVDTNAEIYNSRRTALLLRQELAQLDEETTRSEQIVRDLQSKYDDAAARLQILEARQKAVQRNADLLLQKLQEAQLAKDQELSDVSIAAPAVKPERHFFPRRSILLAALTLLTFAVLAGALAREKYMELAAE